MGTRYRYFTRHLYFDIHQNQVCLYPSRRTTISYMGTFKYQMMRLFVGAKDPSPF